VQCALKQRHGDRAIYFSGKHAIDCGWICVAVQAATEKRQYHSKEAIEMGLDPAGQEKALERMAIADHFWTAPADENPVQRRLRRYSAGHAPNSASAFAHAETIASRPSSRGSMGSEPIISADYDGLHVRPPSRDSVSLGVASGDGTRPGLRGIHPCREKGDGILRPVSRGDEGILRASSRSSIGIQQDELRPASWGSVVSSRQSAHSDNDDSRPGSRGILGLDDRPTSRGSVGVDNMSGIHDALRPASRGSLADDINDRPGSSVTGSVNDGRPGSEAQVSSRPASNLLDDAHSVSDSRPASRANVRFSDGSRPGTPARLDVVTPTQLGVVRFEFDGPGNTNTLVLSQVPSPRFSDSESEGPP